MIEEQLPVAEARAGEREAWEILYRRFQLPLYAYACELLQNETAALDVVQETFISAARHLQSLREDGKFGSWLFRIAHQKCIQRWRKRDRDRFEILEPELPEDQPDPGEILIRQEEEEAFNRAMDRVAPDQKALLLLHFLENFGLAEIGSVLGIPEGTVKSRMHAAKRALRRALEELK